jgi:2-polyprenyl-6-hydroxyphenyl methylase/3-demethylubiquinone-9 3-methyltransferase
MVGSEGKFAASYARPDAVDYITRQIAAEFDRDLMADKPFDGLRILDIGCGGGIAVRTWRRVLVRI